jgi:DNA mismatch endonuclease, patch repair protein
MQGNRGRDTKPEVAIRSALHKKGLRFRKDARPEPSINCRADIVFLRERVAVFVDGCYWHCCPIHGVMPATNRSYWQAKLARNVERDRRNDAQLRQAGWQVVRVWEHEPSGDAALLIARVVKQARERLGCVDK